MLPNCGPSYSRPQQGKKKWYLSKHT
jgi:hypothetical protein